MGKKVGASAAYKIVTTNTCHHTERGETVLRVKHFGEKTAQSTKKRIFLCMRSFVGCPDRAIIDWDEVMNQFSLLRNAGFSCPFHLAVFYF